MVAFTWVTRVPAGEFSIISEVYWSFWKVTLDPVGDRVDIVESPFIEKFLKTYHWQVYMKAFNFKALKQAYV